MLVQRCYYWEWSWRGDLGRDFREEMLWFLFSKMMMDLGLCEAWFGGWFGGRGMKERMRCQILCERLFSMWGRVLRMVGC